MRIVLVSAASLAATALLAGCGGSGSGDTSSSPARVVNQSLQLTQGDGSALVTLESVTDSFDGDGVTAKSGNFVGAKLRFEGKSGTYKANPLYIMLKKGDGVVEIDDLAVPHDESLLGVNDTELGAGEAIEGTVAFDTAFDPAETIVVTDELQRILGVWPISGDKPTLGDGGRKRDINQSQTVKNYDDSAVATLVSVSESTGPLDDVSKPESGHLVIAEVKFEGKTGDYGVSADDIKLKKPDGTMIDENEGNGSYGVPDAEQFHFTDLAAGKTVTGKVGFDTPLEPGSHIVITGTSDEVLADFPL